MGSETDSFRLAAYVLAKPVTLSINKGFTDAAVLHAKGANIPLWHHRRCPSNSALLTIWRLFFFFFSPSLLTEFSLKVVLIEQDESRSMFIEPSGGEERRGGRGSTLQQGEGPWLRRGRMD